MRPCNLSHPRLQQAQSVPFVRSVAKIGGEARRTAVVSSSLSLLAPPPLPSRSRSHHRQRQNLLRAMEPSRGGVGTEFDGAYGPWTLEESDVLEVKLYRASLLVSSLAFAGVVVAGGGESGGLVPATAVDALAATSAVGLGAALALVHVYVTPLKRFLQFLWAAGCVGAVAVAASHGVGGDSSSLSIAEAVASDPGTIWLVGPAAAAATGLAFKEGLCYGKLEAAALFFAIPSLCLFHLFAPALGIPLEPVVFPLERFGSAAVAFLALVFALNKVLAQPVAEDVGDKSVFTFRKMSPAEQQKVLAEVRSRALFGEDGGRGGVGGGGGSSGSSSGGDDDEN